MLSVTLYSDVMWYAATSCVAYCSTMIKSTQKKQGKEKFIWAYMVWHEGKGMVGCGAVEHEAASSHISGSQLLGQDAASFKAHRTVTQFFRISTS